METVTPRPWARSHVDGQLEHNSHTWRSSLSPVRAGTEVRDEQDAPHS